MTQGRAVRSIIATVAVATSSCAANGPARAIPASVASPHFRVEPLAEGVWAVLATPGGHLVSNAAIIDVGGATAVFDAGASLEAGRALRASAEALTGRPVRWLILSHGHADNSRGAAAFDERTEVIAAEATSRLMDHEARDIAKERGEYPPRAAKLRTQAASAPTPAERLELGLSAGLLEALAEPDARLRLPDSHVVPRVLEGTRRKIVLDVYRGHTMRRSVDHDGEIDPNTDLQGGTVFNRIVCAQCHLLKDYVTPANPANGVPGNMKYRPRTDFLLHDIGTALSSSDRNAMLTAMMSD